MQVQSGEHFSVFRSKTMKTTSRLLIGVSCIAAAMTAPAFAQDATAEADDSASSSEIVVTGSRGQGRTVISSPTPIRSEEHTSELQSLMRTSYAVFCLKQK